MGLTHDATLFKHFEDPDGYGPIEDIIACALLVKRSVVEVDIRETELRQVLNFGHTIGHGIEAASDGAMLHGECVGLGMLPLCAPGVRVRLTAVLERFGLPTHINVPGIDPERVITTVSHDKKVRTDGKITVATVPEVGRFEMHELTPDTIRKLVISLFHNEPDSADDPC